jgi:hypothetical protein
MEIYQYTVEEIERAIEYDFDDGDEEFYQEMGSLGHFLQKIEETAVEVERDGGGEGDGDYMDVVFQIGNQYFRKTGTHNSWDANDWDGQLVEVEPYQELVTKYRVK